MPVSLFKRKLQASGELNQVANESCEISENEFFHSTRLLAASE